MHTHTNAWGFQSASPSANLTTPRTSPSVNRQETFERMPLAARRALLRRVYTRHQGRPMTRDALRDVRLCTARPADAVGITEAELERVERAATALARRGQYAQAQALYAWLVSADPLRHSSLLALGTLALDQHDDAAAQRWFSAAIDAYAGDLGAYAGRAIARLRSNDVTGAIADADVALEFDAEGAQPLTVRMAQVFAELGAPSR